MNDFKTYAYNVYKDLIISTIVDERQDYSRMTERL